jgi:hypothetical protein
VAPFAHTLQHSIKVPQHFVHIQYPIWICDPVRSLLWPHQWHYNVTWAQVHPQNPPATCRGVDHRIRVAPYAHTQHIKAPQHFVYIQYGCGIQSEACCSLYHYINTTLHGLTGLPPKPKIHPRSAEAYHCKGGPICPSTAYQGRAKTLCTYDRCGMHSEACCSLNNYITTSHGLRFTPKTPKPKSTRDLQRGIAVRVVRWSHMPIHNISRCHDTLYTSNMDLGSSLKPVVASTMTLQHHTGSGLPP